MGAVLLATSTFNCCKAVEETVAVSEDCLRLGVVDLRLADFMDWMPDFDGLLGRPSQQTLLLATSTLSCCKAVEEIVAVSEDCLRLGEVDLQFADFMDCTPDFDGNLERSSQQTLLLDCRLETTSVVVV